jgi:hypothetical protein
VPKKIIDSDLADVDPPGLVTNVKVDIMADVIKTVVKDFNPSLLEEELDATIVPTRDTFFAGFVRSDTDSNVATPQARTVSVDRVAGTQDDAAEGEIRFTFRDPLTGAEDTALDDTLAAHVATGSSADQDRVAQDEADLDQLIADLDDVPTMNNATFRLNVQRLQRIVVRDFKNPTPEV